MNLDRNPDKYNTLGSIVSLWQDDGPDIPLHTVLLDNGPVWHVLHLNSAQEVLAVDSTRVVGPIFEAIGLIGAHPPGAECDYEVRMLAPPTGMNEDPIHPAWLRCSSFEWSDHSHCSRLASRAPRRPKT